MGALKDGEICDSLKLMTGVKQMDRREGRETMKVNSLFLYLLLLIKESDYTLLSLFIHFLMEKRLRTRDRF